MAHFGLDFWISSQKRSGIHGAWGQVLVDAGTLCFEEQSDGRGSDSRAWRPETRPDGNVSAADLLPQSRVRAREQTVLTRLLAPGDPRL